MISRPVLCGAVVPGFAGNSQAMPDDRGQHCLYIFRHDCRATREQSPALTGTQQPDGRARRQAGDEFPARTCVGDERLHVVEQGRCYMDLADTCLQHLEIRCRRVARRGSASSVAPILSA